ncbi:hypothetical protein DTO166G4_2355 [Paecilomyces variotii]|nr:hypothetical protein DTO166G4_2355 [Paecilomyces variotii]KAJ9240692.1 hypothetical protein DTO166G5_1501 [Paecilomyces variotii]KAJ9305003.1 hypothetical protein DTO217A2_5495 [Paecilomyces variotii]
MFFDSFHHGFIVQRLHLRLRIPGLHLPSRNNSPREPVIEGRILFRTYRELMPAPSSSPPSVTRSRSVSTTRARPISSIQGPSFDPSGLFSKPTEFEIKRLTGKDYWACGAIDPQIAHMVAKADSQI